MLITNSVRAPALSEVIAKDNTGEPFIAVTQDGKGNVVYDGGFPKFTNISLQNPPGTWPTTLPSTFAGMSSSHKYLHNAIQWVSNKTKVNAGNKKVLIVGNSLVSDEYAIKGSYYHPVPGQGPTGGGGDSGAGGFADVLNMVTSIAGYTPTFYDMNDAGGASAGNQINLGLSDLEPYALVIYIASYGATGKNKSRVSERFASELATYRELGNGVIIITDHSGGEFNSVDEALAINEGLFSYDGTKVSAYYGAYFSGNYDRTNVLVSDIRAQLIAAGGDGTHPLLNNLADNSYVFAGFSESMIKVEDYASSIKDPTKAVTYTMNTAQEYRYNVLVQLDDANRTILTQPLKYIIRNPSDLIMITEKGLAIGATYATNKTYFDTALRYSGTDGSTLTGRITLNDNLIGYFKHTEGELTQRYMLSGPFVTMPLTANANLAFKVETPFRFDVVTSVALRDPKIMNDASYQLATFIQAVGISADWSAYPYSDVKKELFDQSIKFFKEWDESVNYPIEFDWNFMRWARRPWNKITLGTMFAFVAQNDADWATRKPTTGQRGDAAIFVDSGKVMTFDDITTDWVLHPQTADQLFGLNRTVQARDNHIFKIGVGGKLTLIN